MINRISKIQAKINKKKFRFSNEYVKFNYIFFDSMARDSRNQYNIESKTSGLVCDIKTHGLIKLDNLLSDVNESFLDYGQQKIRSELQIYKKIGSRVDEKERIASLYTDDNHLHLKINKTIWHITSVKYESKIRIFNEFVDSLNFRLNEAIDDINLSTVDLVLENILEVFKIILISKNREFEELLSKDDRDSFSFIEDNEVYFLETILMKALIVPSKKIYMSGSSHLKESLNNFYDNLLKESIKYRMLSTIELCFWHLQELEKQLFEKNLYDKLCEILGLKVNIARIFYAIEKLPTDVSLRLGFQDVLVKLISNISTKKEIRGYLSHCFKNYEIFVSYILTTKYFNKSIVKKCISWLEEITEKFSNNREIIYYSMRSLFMIGTLAIIYKRYSIALISANALNDIEQKSKITVNNIVTILKENVDNIVAIDNLFGNLFVPNTLEDDLIKYYDFFNRSKM